MEKALIKALIMSNLSIYIPAAFCYRSNLEVSEEQKAKCAVLGRTAMRGMILLISCFIPAIFWSAPLARQSRGESKAASEGR